MALDKIYTLQTGVSLKVSTDTLQDLIVRDSNEKILPELGNIRCTSDLHDFLTVVVLKGVWRAVIIIVDAHVGRENFAVGDWPAFANARVLQHRPAPNGDANPRRQKHEHQKNSNSAADRVRCLTHISLL